MHLLFMKHFAIEENWWLEELDNCTINWAHFTTPPHLLCDVCTVYMVYIFFIYALRWASDTFFWLSLQPARDNWNVVSEIWSAFTPILAL
jgi:hypothetical protein